MLDRYFSIDRRVDCDVSHYESDVVGPRTGGLAHCVTNIGCSADSVRHQGRTEKS